MSRWYTWRKGDNYAGSGFGFARGSVFPGELGIRERVRPFMSPEYAISLLIAVGVGVYLFYALLRPERF
jgi:K+-transporting ATPase KdpF subunit